MQDLAGADGIVQDPDGLFDRCEAVPDMHPVEIDVISAKSIQTPLEGTRHVLAVIATSVWVRAIRRHGVFGADNEPISAALQERPEHPFAGAIRVGVGGIDEVATGIVERAEHGPAGGFICAPTGLGAERHGPETQLRNPEASIA